MLVTFKTIGYKGRKDWRQTTRAIGQVKKRWERESMGKGAKGAISVWMGRMNRMREPKEKYNFKNDKSDNNDDKQSM
jgi:hypothetical protein